ncbi:hypothetical protein SDC9_62254 [bioreactor metagenome]|uniref:Anti-sigma-28 factor FlgM C-terminal domain-containing protein n=1 Tax=bioreactor metagenome TaxID=1076179 RepID=A0A644XI33_9ZZZZ
MKIQPIKPSDAISSYLTSVRTTGHASVPAAKFSSDSVELSAGAQKFSSLLKSVKLELERDGQDEELRVAQIAARIQEGSYQVSSSDVVSGILSSLGRRE